MRVLVSSTPGTGHVLPLVPLARALRAAGHDVLWATGADAQDLVRGAGIPATPAGTDVATRTRRFREGWSDVASVPPRTRRAVMFPALFADLSARTMYDELAVVADRFGPDLMVHEPCELAAAPLARRREIPHAAVGFGRFVPPALLSAASDRIADLWLSTGGEPPADCGLYEFLYLHPLPPSFESTPPGLAVAGLRPLEVGECGPAPHAAHSRPSVYVTFGTEFGAVAPWRSVLDAIDALDVRALLTVGSTVDASSLHPLPRHVRVERWVPQADALAGADVMVSHGGAGAMLGAAAAGRPHLVLPMGADHFENADLVQEQGIGTMLEPDEVSPDSVATSLGRLIDDSDVRIQAAGAACDIAAMPPPSAAARLVEGLV